MIEVLKYSYSEVKRMAMYKYTVVILTLDSYSPARDFSHCSHET